MLEGDVRSLPLPERAFDVVWCRLVLGYVPDLQVAFAELARVSAAGASLIVTDFHPAALAAGHRRTFRHGERVFELLTFPHTADALIACAQLAGFGLRSVVEANVGPEVRQLYVQAGHEARYREQEGEPLVLGLSFTRDA